MPCTSIVIIIFNASQQTLFTDTQMHNGSSEQRDEIDSFSFAYNLNLATFYFNNVVDCRQLNISLSPRSHFQNKLFYYYYFQWRFLSRVFSLSLTLCAHGSLKTPAYSWVVFRSSVLHSAVGSKRKSAFTNRRITRAHLPCSSNRLLCSQPHDARLVRISRRCGLREYKLSFDGTPYRVPGVSILYLAKCETAETPLLPQRFSASQKARALHRIYVRANFGSSKFRYGVRSFVWGA